MTSNLLLAREGGVLTITLPYREESKPRTVTVEVAA